MTKKAAIAEQEEQKTAMEQYKDILKKANGGAGGARTKKKGFFSRDKEEIEHPMPCLFLRFLNEVRDDLDQLEFQLTANHVDNFPEEQVNRL